MNAVHSSKYVSWAAVVLSAVVLSALWATNVAAFETYQDGCVQCHPFDEIGFVNVTPHDLHTETVTNDCFVCHETIADNPPVVLSGPNDERGCVGCHGRTEDMGSDTISAGLGAGLIQHHTNAGVGLCAGCHTNADPQDYTPVGEDVLPPFYVDGVAQVNDPCIDFLDNDGDLLYDEQDPDCDVGEGAPVADANGPYMGTVGVAVQFDGTASTDGDGTIVAYDWEFGDGNTGTGATPNHTYTSAGEYTVSLTVTDNDGLTDTSTTTATIEQDGTGNQPPVVDTGGPYTGRPGEAVQFDGTGSFDPDGEIFAYLWDFGDGSPLAMGPEPTHTYQAEGTFTVTLTVADASGALTSDTTTVEISEDQQPPPSGGDAWTVRVLSNTNPAGIEFQVAFEDFGGILWVEETFPDMQFAFGIGQRSDGIIFWMDSLGGLYYGMMDQDAGTLMGIVYNFMGDPADDTIFFGEN